MAIKPSINGYNRNQVADLWQELSNERYNPLVADCIALRRDRQLCDWAYLKVVEAASKACTSNADAATVMSAFILAQTGYKVRLGYVNSGGLMLFFSCNHDIHDMPYVPIGNDKFYSMSKASGMISFCNVAYPGEQKLSLWIKQQPKLDFSPSPMRTISGRRPAGMSADVRVNKNLIDFYNTYPTSSEGADFKTRWAMYAQTPMAPDVVSILYPQLRKILEPLTEYKKVEYLLNWLQTSLVYMYDNEVWGGDRAFFAEETLFYPGCDCEDHAILFSRLIRDLVGLDVALVYYPGHLASAVAINDSAASGDYLLINGRRCFICDPTIKGMGASPGTTMRNVDVSKAQAILLR